MIKAAAYAVAFSYYVDMFLLCIDFLSFIIKK